MRKLLRIAALSSWVCSACLVFAEGSDSSEADFLSFEQKVRIAQIITSRTPPVTNINFSMAVNESVPPGNQLESFPPEAEAIAPQLHEFGYIVVEELIAVADERSRKIVIVIPRWG
jgi:hypothetical protein